MTLKLAVNITADASSLKGEAASGKAAIQTLGAAAAPAAAAIGAVDRALDTTAKAARVAQTANTALATSQTQLAATSASAVQGARQLDQALDATTRAGREAAQSVAGLATANERLKAFANDNPFKSQGLGADELRAKYDQLYAIGLRYREQVAEIRAAHDAGKIGFHEMGAMIDRAGESATQAQTAYVRMNGGLRDAGGAVRLTAGQVQNLGYQVNDLSTMLLMGASPFQIIASQGGQIVQALGDGPGGVKGSIAAIGTSIASLATRIGPVGFALAGATAAAGALWWMSSGSEAKEAANSIDEYRGVVDRLKASFQGVSEAAAGVWERAAIPTESMALGQLQDAAAKAKAELQEARDILGGAEAVSVRTGTIGSALAVFELLNGEVRETKGELQDLYGQFARGEIDARRLGDAAARIQIDPAASDRTRELAGEVRRLAEQFGTAAANVQAIEAAIEAMSSGKEGRLAGGFLGDLRARFGDVGTALDRMAPETMAELRRGLEDQAEGLNDAGKAATDYAKSLEGLRAGWADSTAELRLQVATFGQSAGAIASARFEHQALAEARQLAADADKLFDENGADAARIREVAGEVGVLTDQLKAMGDTQAQAKRVADTLADLQFRGSLIGMSNVDREIATTVNRLNLDMTSTDAQLISGRIRYNDQLQKTEDRLEAQRGLYENIASTVLDIFDPSQADSYFDHVMKHLADIGAPLTNDMSRLLQEIAQ